MKKLVIGSLMLLTPLCVTAEEAPPAQQAVDIQDIDLEEIVLTVNGQPMTTGEVIAYQYNREGPALPQDPLQLQNMLVNELLNSMLLAQEAERTGLDKEPIVVAELSTQRTAALRKAMLNRLLNEEEVSDEELKKAYDESYGNFESSEYRARHILVDNEARAKELIEELNKGADFVTLAKENSTGPSGPNGGDLGWFTTDTMVKPFGDAVKLMDKGAHSEDPVETQFGWHVIKLEDIRKLEKPDIESVKEELTTDIRVAKVRAKMDALRESAKIVVPETPQEAVK